MTAQHEDVQADQFLVVAQRIADHLLDVQRRVNEQIDATQSQLLPEVRRQLGYEPEAADLAGLTNTRIVGLDVVVTPEAVATSCHCRRRLPARPAQDVAP